MDEYARKYPFLFLLPSLIAGVVIGSKIQIDNNICILSCLLIAGIMVTIHKFCPTTIIELLIPITTTLLGVIAAQAGFINRPLLPNDLSKSFISLFADLKELLITKNEKLIENRVHQTLANAITLGERGNLPNEIKTIFSKCGIMHIIAVSGLHVGAIFILINKCLSFSKGVKRIKRVLSLSLIWIYSFLVGAPESVIRASSILTYITIGESFNKTYSSLNGVFACAFITLLISPQSLKSLSFQLSYSAYIGIITLFPLFSPAKRGGNTILKRVIASISITIAAQLATLPITLYYFHETSTNSFLINLIVIPIVSILLYSNIFALLLPYPFSIIPAYICDFCCWTVIKTTYIFAPINIHFEKIYISEITILLYYILIFSTFFTLTKRFFKF